MPLLRLPDPQHGVDVIVNTDHIVSLRRSLTVYPHETRAVVTLAWGHNGETSWRYQTSYRNLEQPGHDSRAMLAQLLVLLADSGVTLVGLDEDTHVAPTAISSMTMSHYPAAVHVHFGSDSVSWAWEYSEDCRKPQRLAAQRLTELEKLVQDALTD